MKKLSESVWGDIRKKSLGREERMEDSINTLNGDGMLNYINDHYMFNVGMFQPMYSSSDKVLSVPVIKTKKLTRSNIYRIYYNYKDNEVYVPGFDTGDLDVFKDLILKDRFLIIDHDGYLEIKPENGEDINNWFFLKVIDHIIDTVDLMDSNTVTMLKKLPMNESVWGDLRKKSLGQEARVEADINRFDIIGLCDYLNTAYENLRNINITHGDKYISVPLFVHNYFSRSMILCADDSSARVRETNFQKWPQYLKDHLYEKYTVVLWRSEDNEKMYFIRPKSGEPDNKFLICLIDDIIGFVDKPLLKKKVNESVWGELRKKSLGQEARIENKIGNLKNLSPVDMGENSEILWADTDLILNDGTYKFTYEEAEVLQKKISELPNKSLSEWRLPTLDETETIRNFILRKCYDYDNEKITISSSQNELIFLRRFDDGYQSWAVDKPNCPCMNLEIDEHFHSGVILHTTIMTGRNSRKACIRLVKSK